MNPFTTPDRLYISRRPQDMRAGIQRLASVVTTDFSMDPTDGALYCFVSRDCLKMKLLRFETNGWCMYYVRLAEGGFRWRHSDAGAAALQRAGFEPHPVGTQLEPAKAYFVIAEDDVPPNIGGEIGRAHV